MAIVLSEVSQRFDIIGFLQQYTEVRAAESRYGEWMILCPYCPDYGHKLKWRPYFNTQKGIYNCFRCDSHGYLIDLVMHFGGFNYGQAMNYMSEGLDERPYDVEAAKAKGVDGLDKRWNEWSADVVQIERLPEFPLPPGFVSLVGQQLPYTIRRRIPQAVIDEYGLGYCPPGSVWVAPDTGKTYDYSNYLILPDRDINGRVLYWTARDMTDTQYLRYKNPPSTMAGIGSGSFLFNFHRASQHRQAVLVEGYLDALRVGNDCMATYGMGLKGYHKNWLIRGGFEEIVLLDDGDGSVPASHIQNKARDLEQLFKVRVARLPYHGDPDSYNRSSLREIIDAAPAFEDPELMRMPVPVLPQ